jgi:hypothetical protein
MTWKWANDGFAYLLAGALAFLAGMRLLFGKPELRVVLWRMIALLIPVLNLCVIPAAVVGLSQHMIKDSR